MQLSKLLEDLSIRSRPDVAHDEPIRSALLVDLRIGAQKLSQSFFLRSSPANPTTPGELCSRPSLIELNDSVRALLRGGDRKCPESICAQITSEVRARFLSLVFGGADHTVDEDDQFPFMPIAPEKIHCFCCDMQGAFHTTDLRMDFANGEIDEDIHVNGCT